MMKLYLCFLLVLITSVTVFPRQNEHNESSDKDEEFNSTEVIMHHIKDAHEWHLWTTTNEETGKEHHVAIPLPIILFYDGSVDIFLSSEFHHHDLIEKRNHKYLQHHGKIYVANKNGGLDYDEEGKIKNDTPLDFSITKNVAGMLVASIILLLIFITAAKKYKKYPGRPKGIQSFMEPLVLFIRDDVAKPNIGEKKYAKHLPYLLTIFFFILINNLLGLVPFFPGGANVTGNIAFTMTMAVFTLIITNFSGNKAYWKHVFATPGVPVWLYPIMIPVEIIGIISKPFALMVRLFANITAGHIIVLSLVSLIFIFKSVYISPVSAIFVIFMDCLEILVAFLQAYIFTLLSALFIGLAVKDEH